MIPLSDPRWKTAETLVAAKDPTDIDLKVRQSAYNIAKSILEHNESYSPLTRRLAETYFNLMHGSGTEAARAHAASALHDQLKAELQAAEALVKVIPKHMKIFLDAASEHTAHI